MLKGFIYNGELGVMVWEEPKENGSVKFFDIEKNRKKKVVIEQGRDNIPLRYTEAYLCESCRKVIIDFK